MNKRERDGEGERDDRDRDRKGVKRGVCVGVCVCRVGAVGRFPCITRQLDCVTHVYSLCWLR